MCKIWVFREHTNQILRDTRYRVSSPAGPLMVWDGRWRQTIGEGRFGPSARLGSVAP